MKLHIISAGAAPVVAVQTDAGAAPVVAVQTDAGVTAPAAATALQMVSAGGACWLFLSLTLSSSDAGCSV